MTTTPLSWREVRELLAERGFLLGRIELDMAPVLVACESVDPWDHTPRLCVRIPASVEGLFILDPPPLSVISALADAVSDTALMLRFPPPLSKSEWQRAIDYIAQRFNAAVTDAVAKHDTH